MAELENAMQLERCWITTEFGPPMFQASRGDDGIWRSYHWIEDRWVEFMVAEDIGLELAWETKVWRRR